MYKYFGNTGIEVSPILQYLGFVLLVVYNFLNFKTKKGLLSNFSECNIRHFSVKKSKVLSKVGFWTAIEIIIISLVQYAFTAQFNTMFGNWSGGTGLNYFGTLFISPIFLYLLFYFVSIDPLKQMDLITPAHPLALACSKIGCLCFGCCGGFECDWGLYFPSKDITCFPTQILEIAQAFILFIILHIYKDKVKPGTIFPIYLISYSATRFFIEFTSSRDPEFWRINMLHINCVMGVIVGVLYFVVINKWSDKIVELFDRGFIYENGRCKRAKTQRKKIKLKK